MSCFDEDVDKLIKRKFAEWEKKKQKEEDEAKKLAKMNAQEKADYKNRQLEDRIAELEREKTLSSMKDEARKMLSEKNINISDELLAFMVASDAEKTKTAVDSFAELFNAAVNEAIKSKARQSVPKEGGRFNPDIRALSGIADMAREARIIAELFNAAVNEAIKSKARQSVPKEGGRFNPDIRALSGIADMAREARIIK